MMKGQEYACAFVRLFITLQKYNIQCLDLVPVKIRAAHT